MAPQASGAPQGPAYPSPGLPASAPSAHAVVETSEPAWGLAGRPRGEEGPPRPLRPLRAASPPSSTPSAHPSAAFVDDSFVTPGDWGALSPPGMGKLCHPLYQLVVTPGAQGLDGSLLRPEL